MRYAANFPYKNTCNIYNLTSVNNGVDIVETKTALYTDLKCNTWTDSRRSTFQDGTIINTKIRSFMFDPLTIDLSLVTDKMVIEFNGVDYTIENPEDYNDEEEMIVIECYRTGNNG